MKVLLVHPVPPAPHWPQGVFRSRWVPTGLAYLGAALQHAGHEVRAFAQEEHFIRSHGDRAAADRAMRDVLEEFRPDAVGLSIFTPAVGEAARIAAQAKELLGARVLAVVGGPHPSALPEQTLAEFPAFDVAVIGEGEHTVVELLDRGPRADVAGIAYRADGVPVRTTPRPVEHDLDSLGPPAYDLFDMAHYTAPDRWMVRWLRVAATNIRTSRGCTNRCRFCAAHVVAGVGVRFHSLDYVMDQVMQAVERWHVQAVHFEDDTMGGDRERLLDLCERMRSAGLHRRIVWECCLRVDQPDTELLARMKSAGCIQVEYGFESGSDASLVRLGKDATAELNRRAVRLTREAGLRIFADIMVGLPGETEDDLRATVRFLRWAKPDVISAASLAPLPGTPIYDALTPEQRAALTWEGFSYLDAPGFRVNLTAMPDERWERLYKGLMRHFIRPAVARELLRDTPPDMVEERRFFSGRVRSFALRHPIHALRLPYRLTAASRAALARLAGR